MFFINNNKIMVDKNSAPAFSVGNSKRYQQKNNGMPGPGTYANIHLIRSPKSQSKISKQHRFNNYQTSVPGPGTYQDKNNDHIPSAKIVSRKIENKTNDIPGPGSYQPDYKKLFRSYSGYKLGSAQKSIHQNQQKNKLPGPGQYQAKSTLAGVNQGIKFNPSQRKLKLCIERTQTPAPNTYNQNGTYNGKIRNQPKISFSKSQRAVSACKVIPAPNNYSLTSQFDQGKDKKKGFTLSSRTKTNSDLINKIPGPGTYQLDAIQNPKKVNPCFSMSKGIRLKIDKQIQTKDNPGPTSYNVKPLTPQHQSFSIGKSNRAIIENINKVPGPGNYEIKINKNQPSFSVSKSKRKTLVNEKNNKPGPGQYEPRLLSSSQYQSIKIGKDCRRTFDDKRDIPGPGAYRPEIKLQGGNTFGHQKRIPDKKDSNILNPGPGNYKIPSTISNLPQYVNQKLK